MTCGIWAAQNTTIYNRIEQSGGGQSRVNYLEVGGGEARCEELEEVVLNKGELVAPT